MSPKCIWLPWNCKCACTYELIEHGLDAKEPPDILALVPLDAHDERQRNEALAQQPLECDLWVADNASKEGDESVEEGHEGDAGNHDGRDVEDQRGGLAGASKDNKVIKLDTCRGK